MARDVVALKPGDAFPDYVLTNQLGEAFHLESSKGQALAVTFLFTRCPFPTFCPKMAANFQAAQQKLEAIPGAPSNWHLLSVSFDPEFDQPAILKAYAEGHGYNPRRWTFATGALVDVTAMGEQVGLQFWREQPASLSHNLRTVVVDRQGHLQRIFEGNSWTVDDLVSELQNAARAPERP